MINATEIQTNTWQGINLFWVLYMSPQGYSLCNSVLLQKLTRFNQLLVLFHCKLMTYSHLGAETGRMCDCTAVVI